MWPCNASVEVDLVADAQPLIVLKASSSQMQICLTCSFEMISMICEDPIESSMWMLKVLGTSLFRYS